MSSRMAWRTAGNVGRGGGPLILFFPPCCFKPAILEESVGDHRHERMTVKALPGSTLEVGARRNRQAERSRALTGIALGRFLVSRRSEVCCSGHRANCCSRQLVRGGGLELERVACACRNSECRPTANLADR